MVCKIYEETGEVPLDCLFQNGCKRECVHEHMPHERGDTRCKHCGSTDVRWRQQGGKWVLFSLEPGKLHRCPQVSASEDFK